MVSATNTTSDANEEAEAPFDDDRHPVDMFVAAQSRLYVIRALANTIATHGDRRFIGHEDEASILANALLLRVDALIAECREAYLFLDRQDVSGDVQ